MQSSVGDCSRTAPGCVHTTGCARFGNECSRMCAPWVAAPVRSNAHLSKMLLSPRAAVLALKQPVKSLLSTLQPRQEVTVEQMDLE